MGCGTSSPGRCSTIETQYKLMRLAQSQGLFCEASRALAAVKASPGSSAEDLLPSILADLKPLAPAPMPLDPRHVTPDTLRAAAAELAANQSPSDDGSNPEPHLPGPLELQYLEETAPAMKPEDIPAGLRTHIERCETCAICASPLLPTAEEGKPSGLPLRQLACSHAFHCACIDPWITAEEGTCPMCRAVLPRPASELAAQKVLLSLS